MNPKQMAAEKAIDEVKDKMIIGLGTGSTAYFAIQKLGEKTQQGLKVKAVASSKNTEDLARKAGIEIIPFSEVAQIDITIDGADEIDHKHNLTKGGGGALLREKILAFNSRRLLIIVDDSKLVDKLGAFPLPVEIVPFAVDLTLQNLQTLNCKASLRTEGNNLFITDNGNYIADCRFKVIDDPESMNTMIHLIPGVVETGLFAHKMVSQIIVGYEDGSVKIF